LGTAPAAQAILPGARNRQRPHLSDMFVRFSITMTLFASFAITVTLVLIGTFAEMLELGGGLHTMTVGAAWLLPGIAVGTLREYLARSAGETRLALLPRDVIWTAACMAALVGYPAFGENLVVGCALLLVTIEAMALTLLLRRMGCWPYRSAPLHFFRQWRRRSLALMVNNTGGLVLDRFDIFVVGLLFPLDAAALYSVANRLAPLVSLSQRFIVPVQISKIALAMSQRDLAAIWMEVRVGLMVGLGYAASVLMLFSMTSQLILGLYGAHYLQAAPFLMILSLGQAATALGSNFGMVASVGPRKMTFALSIWLVVLPGSIIAYLAGVWFGMIGVSIATAATLITYNIALTQLALVTLGAMGPPPPLRS